MYARYSSRFQHSIDDQVRTCREWAERAGLKVVEIFSDEAVTGKSSRRRGLRELRESLERNRADVVVIFMTNRLYRKMYQSLAFVEEEIVDRGKRCVFVQSGIDTADADDWRQRIQLHAPIDKFLVQTIGKHVHAAAQVLKELTVTLGDENMSGIVIDSGSLKSMDFTINGDINLFKMTASPKDLRVHNRCLPAGGFLTPGRFQNPPEKQPPTAEAGELRPSGRTSPRASQPSSH
ncbi:hypothetical protein GC176_22760 [bacterium]|nr:hypothetical protein [bacterium]